MIFDDKGMDLSAFEPGLAAILGADKGDEGVRLLTEAGLHGHARVELRDVFFCLARATTTATRKRLVDITGMGAAEFVAVIEENSSKAATGAPPLKISSAAVAPEVSDVFTRAETLAREVDARIGEPALMTALLEAIDPELRGLLLAWCREDRLKAFQSHLRAEIGARKATELFDGQGRLANGLLAPGGRKLLRRTAEDAGSLGLEKISARVLLYTLLGDEAGALSVALAGRGIEVKRDLHAKLARELARPGRKRTTLEATKNNMLAIVEQILKQALGYAAERGPGGITVQDVARAFVMKQPNELTRLLPAGAALDLTALRDELELAPAESDDEAAIQRLTIVEIEQRLRARVRGQDAAISRVLPWVKRLRFGLPRDGRPAAVFLFLGPTGTGKTQLAKELARHVFGDEDQLLFIEMGQFQTKESMSGFIGAPPGYVGYGDGKLTNGLRDKPECVVLFDEIEKAHTSVFDTLLRFADEGLISDPAGPVRDGRKCVIVLTTNAGQTWLREHLQLHPEDPGPLAEQLFEAAMKELSQKGFRPEFLGRLDERITFLPFTIETCGQIVDDVLGRELGKFAELKGITVTIREGVKTFLAKAAHQRSIDEGARGAPRVVNDHVITPAIDVFTTHLETRGALPPRAEVVLAEGRIAVRVLEGAAAE
jgi:ATP-dependent Clp protease ATP-binding subunit ClpC